MHKCEAVQRHQLDLAHGVPLIWVKIRNRSDKLWQWCHHGKLQSRTYLQPATSIWSGYSTVPQPQPWYLAYFHLVGGPSRTVGQVPVQLQPDHVQLAVWKLCLQCHLAGGHVGLQVRYQWAVSEGQRECIHGGVRQWGVLVQEIGWHSHMELSDMPGFIQPGWAHWIPWPLQNGILANPRDHEQEPVTCDLNLITGDLHTRLHRWQLFQSENWRPLGQELQDPECALQGHSKMLEAASGREGGHWEGARDGESQANTNYIPWKDYHIEFSILANDNTWHIHSGWYR